MGLSQRDALGRSLRLEPGEVKQVATLTLHSFCVVGATMIGRSARDALFLERAPTAWLPWMYFFSAMAVSLVGFGYGRISESFRRDRIASAGASILGAVTLALWILYALDVAPLAIALAFYLAVEVMAALTILQLWTLANDIFDSRQARRIFPLIGLGGSLSNILVGLAGAALAATLGTGSLIAFCAVLLFAVSWLAIYEGRLLTRAGKELTPPPRKRAGRGMAPVLAEADPHLVSIALLVGVTFLTTTIIDYQFKLAARSEFSGARLAAFFSAFYALTGVLAFGTQTLATRRMLKRVGLLGALAFLPLGLGFGSALFLVAGAWWAASISQGLNLTFRYTINDASMQMLYLPMSPGLRGRAKSLIEGVEKPVAIGVAALFLLVYQRAGADLRHLSIAALILLAIWGWLLFRTRDSYLGSLEQKLRLRRLDLDEVRLAGSEAAAVLSRALRSPDAAEVEHALELLPRVNVSGLEAPLLALLRHEAASIRRAALAQVARLENKALAADAVRARFQDPDPEVRAAAFRAYCRLRPERTLETLGPLILEASLPVRASAISVLILQGGLDGVLAAGPKLREMVSSASAVERCWGARILGEVGLRTFSESLLALFGDPDPAVRRAAVESAGKIGGLELAPKLISLLDDAEVSAEAADALVSLGTGIEEPLAGLLRDPQAPRSRRLNVPRVLARVGSEPAARILCQALELEDEALRTQVLIALSRLPKTSPPPDQGLIQQALDVELGQAYRLLSCAQALQLPEAASLQSVSPSSRAAAEELLGLALEEQRFRSLERVLLLLGLLLTRLRRANLRPEFFRLHTVNETASGHRAFALELLDNLVPRELGRRLLPLWESGSREQRLGELAALYPEPPRTREAWLAWIPSGASPWVHACALNYGAHLGQPVDGSLVALESLEPRVREAAVTSLAQLGSPLSPSVLERLLTDPDPGVRRQAGQFSVHAARGNITPTRRNHLMIPTLERVLFLKAAELFSQLPGDELAPMAALATEEQHAAGADVLKQGEIGDALFLIVEGRVRMHRRGRVLATLGPRDSFGEMEVLDPAPRFATVTAETDVTLLKLAENDVRELLHEKHDLALGIIQVLTRRLRTANRTKA